jgi:RHS repeat-associated protein
MLKTNEIAGEGNSFSTEFRQYDPRLGKWLSLDPLMEQFPWMSPFVGFDNNPILYVDPWGLSSTEGDENKKKEGDKKEVEPEKKDNSYIDKDGKIIPDKLGLPDNPEADGVYTGNNGKSYTMLDGEWIRCHQLSIAKVDNNKSKEKKNDSYKGLKANYLSAFEGFSGQLSTFKPSFHQSTLMEQYTNFGKNAFYGGFTALGSVPIVAYTILTAPVWAPYAWNIAKGYHYTVGVNGGYANMALNWMNQSYSQGGSLENLTSLEGKSITSLIMSGSLTYSSTLGGQMAIGSADPWVNISYSSKGLYNGGYLYNYNPNGSRPTLKQTTALSIMGMFGPLYQQSPLLKSHFGNFTIEQLIMAPAQRAVTNEK